MATDTNNILEKTLTSRLSKLPRDSVLDYASPTSSGLSANDDACYKFMGMVPKSAWGACSHQYRYCFSLPGKPNTFVALGPAESPSAHFITDSALLLPKGAKVTRWTMKMGTQDVQIVDSWFAGDILTKFKRDYKEVTDDGDLVITPVPFFYTENLLKAFPLFMPNSSSPHFEFEISFGSSPNTTTIQMMNEYCSSEIESSSVQDLDVFIQYIPTIITMPSVTVPDDEEKVEIPLNSNKKIVKALYFRVYNDSCDDLPSVVQSVELKPNGEKIPVMFCRKYFKNKYSTSSPDALPYYVIPFCPNPKSSIQEYGEVFSPEVEDSLVLGLKKKTTTEGGNRKVEVALEFVNRIVWSTKATL